MPAANIDIEIEQGSKFDPTFTWKDDNGNPVDITGWEGKMEIREKKNKNSPLIHRSQTSDGSMTIVGDAGQIKPIINAVETDGFDFDWAWYDIELTPPSGSSGTKRLSQGKVRLDKSVTD